MATGLPISDGYSAQIADGYSGYVDDGYPVAGLPYHSPLQTIFNLFHQGEDFPGRRRRVFSYGSAAPALPYRRAVKWREDFREQDFPGRRRKRTAPLIGFSTGYLVSQYLIESLTQATLSYRVSQMTAEVLSQASLSYRVSQYLLEVLVPNLELPPLLVYPTLIVGFNVIKEPEFSTGSNIATSGKEARALYWSTPRWTWTLTYEYLPDKPARGVTSSDLRTFIGFFLAVCGGGIGFYFQDPDDYIATGQYIGTTDGLTTTWSIQRTYGLADGTGTEPIGGIIPGTPVNVYIAGVLQDPATYTLNTSVPVDCYIQFNTAPATPNQEIAMDFQFYYWARLLEDKLPFEKFMSKLWQNQKVQIYSLKSY